MVRLFPENADRQRLTRTVIKSRSPRWLWRAAWLALGATLTISLLGTVLLSAGAADPPHAGSLIWQTTKAVTWTLLPGDKRSDTVIEPLPAPPFTIEVVARFSVDSPHNAGWSVQLQTVVDQPHRVVTIYNNRTFALDQSGRTPFIHLQPGGLPNRLRLTVLADYSATLRLNDEIAWRGMLNIAGQQSRSWSITASAGNNGTATITWEQIAIYGSAR